MQALIQTTFLLVAYAYKLMRQCVCGVQGSGQIFHRCTGQVNLHGYCAGSTTPAQRTLQFRPRFICWACF